MRLLVPWVAAEELARCTEYARIHGLASIPKNMQLEASHQLMLQEGEGPGREEATRRTGEGHETAEEEVEATADAEVERETTVCAEEDGGGAEAQTKFDGTLADPRANVEAGLLNGSHKEETVREEGCEEKRRLQGVFVGEQSKEAAKEVDGGIDGYDGNVQMDVKEAETVGCPVKKEFSGDEDSDDDDDDDLVQVRLVPDTGTHTLYDSLFFLFLFFSFSCVQY